MKSALGITGILVVITSFACGCFTFKGPLVPDFSKLLPEPEFKQKSPEEIALWHGNLEDPDDKVRLKAVWKLNEGMATDDQVIETAIDVLHNGKDGSLRHEALFVLATLKPWVSDGVLVPALIQSLDCSTSSKVAQSDDTS